MFVSYTGRLTRDFQHRHILLFMSVQCIFVSELLHNEKPTIKCLLHDEASSLGQDIVKISTNGKRLENHLHAISYDASLSIATLSPRAERHG